MKSVSKKTLRKSFLNWFFWNGCSQQAETMLGMAFGQAMAPVIEELYDTKEDRAAALQRHITLFNTEAQVGSMVSNRGIIVATQRESPIAEVGPIRATLASWMASAVPLPLANCSSIPMAIPLQIDLSVASALTTAPWVGPVIYIIVYPIGTYLMSWKLFTLGYKAGLEGVQRFMASGQLDRIMQAISILGLIMVGALTASFVTCTLNIDIKTAAQVFDEATGAYVDGTITVFNLDNLLNTVFPNIVPLALTLGVYRLYSKKHWTPLAIMGLILVLAAALTAIGYIPVIGAYV